jgi:putative ABC transport system permease protein
VTAWRLALRIAWREARQSKGRSALVVAMIAVPVLALSAAAATFDMFQLTGPERYTRVGGAADAMVVWQSTRPIEQDWPGISITSEQEDRQPPAETTARQVTAAMPAGSRVLPYDAGTMVLRTAGGVGRLGALATDAADPMARGLVDVVSGAAPRGPDEIAVTGAAGERLGVAAGDRVSTPDGATSWRVTGVVEVPADLGERVLYGAGALPDLAESRQPTAWLVDTPAPVTWAEVAKYNKRGISVVSRAVYADPPADTAVLGGAVEDTRALDVGLLIAALAVLEIVLLAGPAFAVGARRKQRDLALIAANGATPAHLRRVVLADGLVLGALGALAGTVLGVALALAGRPLVEVHLMQERAGGYRVFPLALLAISALAAGTGLLAAMVPAFTAARADVVRALTGRAGTVRSRRRWIMLGLLLLALGVAAGLHGAVTVSEGSILYGVAAIAAGLVLCTPALLGLLGRLGHLLPLALRISLRDTARNRASAAPAVAAVMAAVAASMAAGIFYTNDAAVREAKYRAGLPAGGVLVDMLEPGQVQRAIDAVGAAVPVATVARVYGSGCAGAATADAYCNLESLMPEQGRCLLDRLDRPATTADQRQAQLDPRCDRESGRYRHGRGIGESVAADGVGLLAVLRVSPADLAESRRVLAAGGMVVGNPHLVTDGQVTLAIRDSRKPGNGQDVLSEKLPRIRVPAHVLTSGVGSADMTIYSPGLIERVGFRPAEPSGFVAIPEAMPTPEQEDRIRAALLPISTEAANFVSVERGPEEPADPRMIAVVLAGLITLGGAAIATGLAAADGRADLVTLAAVGASPGLRRRLSLTQAGVIAGLGSLLGAVAGGAAALAVLFAHNQATTDAFPVVTPYPLEIAWPSLVAALGIPLVAMLGAGLFTRSRLPVDRPAE